MSFSISSAYTQLRSVIDSAPNKTLPAREVIRQATASIAPSLPATGLGEDATAKHLLSDITPGFNGPKISSNYYGFVIGGVFPIAEVADNIVTAFDQNVHVHLPEQSISTAVEDRASSMLVDLLNLGDGWKGRVFTTGATSANTLGLGCAREAVLQRRLNFVGEERGVGELGILSACSLSYTKEIQILTVMGHSSLYKAASIVGIGYGSVKEVGLDSTEPWRIDMEVLERELAREKDGVASIVVLSAGEVNTGRFTTHGRQEMERIRRLCDRFGAWLHVDGAFGMFARCLPDTPEFAALHKSCEGLELADSLTGDGHKMLNVPYDCGFFLTRSATILPTVFSNPNAAYLSTGPASIPSPLNNGLENSRRFRALPVYAVLLAYGRDGMSEMFARQVRLARGIGTFLDAHKGYERLATGEGGSNIERTHIVVIFRAKNVKINNQLVNRVNDTRKMYVSGTKWGGLPACRIAVSTWKVDVDRDLLIVTGILEDVLRDG